MDRRLIELCVTVAAQGDCVVSTGHTASVSDVVVGSKWRNKKSGIVAEVAEIRGDTVLLKRQRRASTFKWIDLLLFEYELVTEDVTP